MKQWRVNWVSKGHLFVFADNIADAVGTVQAMDKEEVLLRSYDDGSGVCDATINESTKEVLCKMA